MEYYPKRNNLSHKQKQALKYTEKRKYNYERSRHGKRRDENNYKLIDTNIDNNIISKITKFCKTHHE